MTDKSYVSMEQHQCFICGAQYDTGAILLDKRLKNSLEPHTLTGTGLCPEHQKLKDDGYIALIEADPKTNLRTGKLAHIRAAAWPAIFGDTPVPAKGVAFIEPEGMTKLENIPQEGDPS